MQAAIILGGGLMVFTLVVLFCAIYYSRQGPRA